MNKTIVSYPKERPKNPIAWWAMGLGVAAALEIPVMVYISSATKLTGKSIGITGIVLTITAVTCGIVAYRKGERSWVLWLGFVPAILLGIFWSTMVIAEIASIIFGLGF